MRYTHLVSVALVTVSLATLSMGIDRSTLGLPDRQKTVLVNQAPASCEALKPESLERCYNKGIYTATQCRHQLTIIYCGTHTYKQDYVNSVVFPFVWDLYYEEIFTPLSTPPHYPQYRKKEPSK